jgi:hypothetical protein
MSPDERTRIELTQRLAELFGDDLATYLMETLPPFSWHEVATRRDLAELESRLDRRFDELEARMTLRFDAKIGGLDSRIGGLDAKIDERTNLLRAEARELQQETIAVFRGELVSNTRQMMYGAVAAMGVVAASIIAAVKL